jgi:hypothetical protein
VLRIKSWFFKRGESDIIILLLVPYPPEKKPPAPFSAVDMAQTGEGAYI